MVDRLGVGIDFGTTNSAAAVFDGTSVRMVRLERDDDIMPSATYIDRELQTETGARAIEHYISDNTGRTVELIPEVIGEVGMLVERNDADSPAPVEGVSQKVYGQPITDSGLQGRLFRGTKRLLGDPGVRRLMVFDHPFRLVALITPLLLRMRRSVADATGKPLRTAHLGHPVNFEGKDRFKNKTALTRLSEAYTHAGVREQVFYPEPIAAAVSYLTANPGVDGEHVLTLDFGGGTLDFCVLRRHGSDFDVVTTHGVGLGGDHIDQRLYRELLFPLLGKGERWRRRGMDREIETRFPFEDYEDLLVNWAVTYTLNQNRYTTPVLDCVAQGGPAAIKFRRLRDLIQHNLSYLVFQEIKRFKAALSAQPTARLDIPEIDVDVSLTRAEFETLIADQLDTVARTLDETLELAQLAPEDVHIVLGTGGSSLIPAVRKILEDRFAGRVVNHDPFTSVAAGLAIASYHGYEMST